MMNLLWDFFLAIGWSFFGCVALALLIIGISFCWHFGQTLVPILMARWLAEKVRRLRDEKRRRD